MSGPLPLQSAMRRMATAPLPPSTSRSAVTSCAVASVKVNTASSPEGRQPSATSLTRPRVLRTKVPGPGSASAVAHVSFMPRQEGSR